MKNELKANEENYNASGLSPMIKISHYDNDKHIKTDIFPITHFLDQSSKDIKSIQYS
tara:strand:- start:130 stop:300 length:171 start_codon:yes stop_codon:yes gene_type:complete